MKVEGVWKYFGDYPALRDVSLAVAPSTCTALLGRNGAGKTTLLRILSGLAKPSKGIVELPDRRKLGLLGHGIGVYDELTAEENLRIFARLFELENPEPTVQKWLERVDLARVKTGLAREFSRGMRQRLALARAFLHAPEVLILDEPFTGLDDRSIALLQSLLSETLARGAAVIMSTHQMREAMELSSHAVLLDKGKLRFSGPRPVEMLEDPSWLYRNYGDAA